MHDELYLYFNRTVVIVTSLLQYIRKMVIAFIYTNKSMIIKLHVPNSYGGFQSSCDRIILSIFTCQAHVRV